MEHLVWVQIAIVSKVLSQPSLTPSSPEPSKAQSIAANGQLSENASSALATIYHSFLSNSIH